MRTVRAAVVSAVCVLLASCSASPPKPAIAPAGPVQDLTLSGVLSGPWTATAGPHGVVADVPPSTPGAATGCWKWVDELGRNHWSAQIAGTADGHNLMLALAAVAQPQPPMGVHHTTGALSTPDSLATLTMDGVGYPFALPLADGSTPSWYALDGDGTTGTVDLIFAQTASTPNTLEVRGRWNCA